MTNASARCSRRHCLALPLVVLAACADAPPSPASKPVAPDALISPWRTVNGGFLSPPGPTLGIPARPGTGMFVRLIAPTALALRGNDLLVVDSGAARLWRIDTGFNTLAAIGGAPTGPGTSVALGADLSAWVLDAGAAQVLRFARDGRLLQTLRAGNAATSSVGFALVDGGATLLLADRALPRWAELRPVGSIAATIEPELASGERLRSVDALAVVGATVYVLDRLAGRVHRVQRDGRVIASLGEGVLRQPSAIAADREGRVFVVDAQGAVLQVFIPGEATHAFEARDLGVVQIGALAVDERFLAVADRVRGQVVIHRLGSAAAR